MKSAVCLTLFAKENYNIINDRKMCIDTIEFAVYIEIILGLKLSSEQSQPRELMLMRNIDGDVRGYGW